MRLIHFFMTILMLVDIAFAMDMSAIKAELVYEKGQEYHEGDIFRARLQIWPVDDQSVLFSLAPGTYIDDALYIAEVLGQQRSEHNADVVQLDLMLVLVQVPKKEMLTIKTEQGEFQVEHGLKAIPTQMKQQTLIMYGQEKEGFGLSSFVWSILILLTLGAFFGLFLLARMYIRKKNQEKEKEKFQKYWAQKFVTANGRHEFEVVYGRKKEWLRLVKLQTPPVVEFFRVMEDVQYKKEWNENDSEVVKETFDNIREIFS